MSKLTSHVDECITFLANKVFALSVGHFIVEAQSSYLRTWKENLKQEEVTILLDFAEKYSFVIQDAVQGFHWENSQATLHPLFIY